MMLILLVLFAAICMFGIRVSLDFREDYLSPANTNCIKGIFVGLVFISHVVQYVMLENSYLDKSFDLIMGILGQNIVIAFLLYSGFGIGEAIKKKGEIYVERIPKHRIFKTWLQFLLILLMFIMLNLCLVHNKYSPVQYFLSLFALQSIGNSTWFVFAILVCWGCSWIAFRACKMDYVKSVWLLILLLVLYIIVIKEIKSGHCWYDTILCYPLGMIVSFNMEKINDRLFKKNIITLLIIVGSGSWMILRVFIEKNIFLYEI